MGIFSKKSEDPSSGEKEIDISFNERLIGDNSDVFEDGEGQLAVDVYQTPSEFIIEAPIAGVNPDDLDIGITSDSVTLKGQRAKVKELRDEDYLYQECFWGKFSRSVILPHEIDIENTHASLKNGILIITLPKLQRDKSRKIKVKTE